MGEYLVVVTRSGDRCYYTGTGISGLTLRQKRARRLHKKQARDVAKRLREERGDEPRLVRLVKKGGA